MNELHGLPSPVFSPASPPCPAGGPSTPQARSASGFPGHSCVHTLPPRPQLVCLDSLPPPNPTSPVPSPGSKQSFNVCMCNPGHCSPPGSSHGISWDAMGNHGNSGARILEWADVSSSRGSSQSREGTPVSCISCIGRRVLYHCTTWEAQPFL